MQTKQAKGALAVIISAICFGLLPLFTKTVYAGGGNPYSAVLFRCALATPLVLIVLLIQKVPLKVTRRELFDLAVIALVGNAITALLLYTSYLYIPSGMATTVHFIYPVMVILGGMLFFGEKPSKIKVAAVALCTGGMVMLSLGDIQLNFVGLAVAFASGLTYAAYIIFLARSSVRFMHPLKFVLYVNTIAALMLLPVTLATGNFTVNLTPSGWGAMLAVSLMVSFIATRMFQTGVAIVGAQKASILSTFEPVTSIIVGILVFSEPITLRVLAGCAIIMAAVVLVAMEKEPAPAKPVE